SEASKRMMSGPVPPPIWVRIVAAKVGNGIDAGTTLTLFWLLLNVSSQASSSGPRPVSAKVAAAKVMVGTLPESLEASLPSVPPLEQPTNARLIADATAIAR